MKQMTKVKNALLITVNDVMLSYDLFVLDVWNQNQHILGERQDIKQMIIDSFSSDKSPLFSVIEQNGKLVLWNMLKGREADYKDKTDFIRTKSDANISIEVYKKLINDKLFQVFRTTKPTFTNINMYIPAFLANDNNFILVYNSLERDMLVSLIQEDERLIDINKFGDWISKHVDAEQDAGVIISLVTDDPRLDIKLAEKNDSPVNNVEHLALIESLICMDTVPNRRYFTYLKNNPPENNCNMVMLNLFEFGGFDKLK